MLFELFHVKHSVLQLMQRFQQGVEIVHAKVLQLDASLLLTGDDLAGTAKAFTQLPRASAA